jgi:hypothetical protein
VGDHHHRGTSLPKAAHEAEKVIARGGVEPGGRLVEHEDLWTHREHAGDGHPSLLAAGERVRRPARQMGRAEQLEAPVDPLSHLALLQPEPARREGHILLHGGGEERRFGKLEDQPHPSPQLVLSEHLRLRAIHEHPPTRRR